MTSGTAGTGGCCGSGKVDPEVTRETVRAGYAAIATYGQAGSLPVQGSREPVSVGTGSGCCEPESVSTESCCESVSASTESCCEPVSVGTGGGCCGGGALDAEQVALAVGYDARDLAALPPTANMGLSCGNPAALAGLKPGEVVLDLGSGGGFDCFVAGPRVGAGGRVIGVDMTAEMLARARSGLPHYRRASGLDNVEFRLGEIEHLPVADATVDVVLSNCVLNLSTDKAATWREIARVLRPGGRVAISDLALLRPLPPAVREDVEALVGCVAGAILLDETVALARAAGLEEVVTRPRSDYVRALEAAGDPLYERIRQALPPGLGPGDYVTSVEIAARKPTRGDATQQAAAR